MLVKLALVIIITLQGNPVRAHGTAEATADSLFPLMLSALILAAFWLMYCIGARRVPATTERRSVFHAASVIAAVAMLSPGSGWMEESSALHMVQHVLIMAVLAPLYVLARPLPQWVAASTWLGVWLYKPLLQLARYPMQTAFIQAVAIWYWHAPRFYNLALVNPWWHLLEHVCLALFAGLFWWSISVKHARAGALLALLFTLVHTAMLGAVLTFAQTPLYSDSRDIQDQQLAGLIMWVPGGLPYLMAAAWCGLYWLKTENRG